MPWSRHAARGLAVLVVASFACDENGRPPPPPEPPLARHASAPSARASNSSPASSALAELREKRLHLDPRRTSPQSLAFAGSRLAQLGERELVVYDTGSFTVETRFPVVGGRSVVSLSDGSLLVAGAQQSLRLPRRTGRPEKGPGLPLFAESQLLPDRQVARRVWVLHAFTSTLYAHSVAEDAAPTRAPERFLELPQFDHQAFASLPDGSFVYSAGEDLHRFFPQGKRQTWSAPFRGRRPWRMLPTRRIDRLLVAYGDGAVQVVQLGPRLRIAKRLQLSGPAYDLDASDDHLAVILLDHEPGSPRRWQLVVLDLNGTTLFRQDLPETRASSSDEWLSALTRNLCVRVAPERSLVAVGGPTSLSVWNYRTGQQRLGGPG